MNEAMIDRVRNDASRKGMSLIEVRGQLAAASGPPLYKLVVPEIDARIYPQGQGTEGAPLGEVAEWLAYPWD
jgi:hypothetical protein